MPATSPTSRPSGNGLPRPAPRRGSPSPQLGRRGKAEDIRVAEFQRTYLLDRRRRRGLAVLKCLPIRVDRGAVGRVSRIVPDRNAVCPSRGGVHIVAEELVG